MKVRFKLFRSAMGTWEALFTEVAEFATGVGPERLIGISHSQEGMMGVVTVWYWAEEGEGVEG